MDTCHARSHASAVGTWQFMKRTARDMVLRSIIISMKEKTRFDTEAAGKYLKDLYTVFKSWELALAAYNWGDEFLRRLCVVIHVTFGRF